MTPREQDLLRIRGGSNNSAGDLERIGRGSLSASTVWYGERLSIPNDSKWYDAISSMMLSLHETSVSSLNDDNRNDEKEIELLEQASSITDQSLRDLEDLINFYDQQYKDAVSQSNNALASHYRELKNAANMEYHTKRSIIQKADTLVKSDKSLFSSHNPILELALEIFDTTTTGAGIGTGTGSAIGSVIPGAGNSAGAAVGAVVGAIAGFGYGLLDHFDSGRNNINTIAYTSPESENRFLNYANSIATRLSYKDVRANQILKEQDDLFYWKTEYPVSNYYRSIELAGTGNYLYYNLPGIVGSSFSDTKDMGQQMTTAVGLNKLASKIPNSKLRSVVRATGFLSALRNGWQQSLNENHAEASETAVKKAIGEIKKNDALRDEMVSNAKNVAIKLYGLDPKDADTLIDEEVAFTMYQGGIGGLNPRKLQNGYDYYKSARQLGDFGADTQFERDMVATAGGDVLEAALMVTPYGALAKKSKTIGRAVAGAAVGAATGLFLGFGVEGSVIGGGIGALAALNRYARRAWRSTMRKTQEIEDKILPRLERQIMFDKGAHAVSAFGVTALAEAAEEGTQYLNSLDAEKVLSKADDKINLRNMKNLFINDLKKRGEVFNAVLSQIGLTDSPYQTDQEFWSNWKGGLVLGGLMTGATVSLSEAVGAKKAYQTAKFLLNEILSSAVANRVASQDAILKGAAFAKYGQNNDPNTVLEIILRAKDKNKNRTDTGYSDEDFDELSNQANRIISKLNHKDTKLRLKKLGYKLGSEEANYAIAVNDYYQQKIRENRIEDSLEYGEKIRLMNDPDVISKLNDITGYDPVEADSFENTDEDSFTYKVRGENGEIEDRTLSNRERLMYLHQNSAELIAIAQLLKDLQDAQKIQEFAQSLGIAFGKNQSDNTISSLRKLYDQIKEDVDAYANESFDSQTTTYDQLIDHLKGYLLDGGAGMKLADLYRNSVLRKLNRDVYTNIVKSLAIDTSVSAINSEVLSASKDMTKRFIDNVQKNRLLQEILDYNIENDFLNADMSELESYAGVRNTDEEAPNEGDLDQDNGVDIDEQEDTNKPSWFLKIKNKINSFFTEPVEDDDYAAPVEGDEELEPYEPEEIAGSTEEAPMILGADLQEETPKEIEKTENEKQKPQVEEKPDAVQEDTEEPPAVIPQDLESAALPQDPQEQVDSTTPATNDEQRSDLIITEDPENAVIPEDLDSAVIIEEEELEQQELQPIDNKQEETVNMLQTAANDSPRKLMNGWYITKDGKIIPSDKMYMMNPVETPQKLGVSIAQKYRLVASQIRFNVHRHILDKTKEGLLKLKLYIAKLLKTADPVVVDAITKAIQNGDLNAVKLLIINSNPVAWESYYVNEFFRDAARRILNGQPVQRPEYIDKDIFKKFCREVILYKNRMQTIYGYKFVTNIAPFITKINGEDVVADPDFMAVDRAGNAHIINVYTINNASFLRRKKNAEMYTMKLGNTKNLFSLDQERNILADIQMKAIRDGGNIIPSSASLLPVVVDGYTTIHRLFLGKLIPLQPNDNEMSKYINQEDQLLELKELLVKANEKTKLVVDDLNNAIDNLRKYRLESKRSGYRLEKKQFVPDKEPVSIAEAYAQLDKSLEIILSTLKYYADHMAKEIAEMETFYKELSLQNKLSEIAKEIQRINNMHDETQTSGILVEVIDGDKVINNSDIITNGVAKATLLQNPGGVPYIKYSIEYKGKTYSIHIYRNKDKKYGKKNGDMFKQNEHPQYTAKMRAVVDLLSRYPGLVLTFDLRRSFIKYGEDSAASKPKGITEKDGLLSEVDVENLGVLQNNGKTVAIGFYDKKTGVIQTGLNSQSATLSHAPEGQWWQNQMFLVVKQKHLEEKKAPDRTVAIPLIRKKFNSKLATFIATCYKIIAETNHLAGYDSQEKRMLANQMLHLFISERKVYKKGEEELPNIVYINGDAVRLNGKEFYLLNNQHFKDFIKELLNCEIMPSWNTFNVKFKNLASGAFSQLYNHFSSQSGPLKISIDGVDSGLEITKDLFDNDTLCQWLVKNQFFASRYYVAREPVVSIHNISVLNSVQLKVAEELKQNELEIKESKPEQQLKGEQPVVMTEEEFNKLDLEEVDEDEEDEDDEYASPIIPIHSDLSIIRQIKTSDDVISTIRKKYPKLAKLLKIAISRVGLPDIKVVVSNSDGEIAIINGVQRQKQGNVIQNKDGYWTITIFRSAKHPVKTLAHEVVHIFTLGAISKNDSVTKACRIFYQYCKDSFAKDEARPYGFKSFKEFIAEFFTNEEFREYLKSKSPMDQSVFDTAVKNIPQEHKNRIRSLYDSIVSFVSKVWQKYVLRQPASLYSQVYDTMSKIFGEAENIRTNEESNEYAVENHITHQKVTLQNCKSRAQLKAAVDGIMTAWIQHENITSLGKNIDKLNFSTKAIQARLEQDVEFAQWYQRTFTYSDIPLVRELTRITRPTREELKTQDNPDGFIQYEKKVKTKITVKKKDGTVITKTVRMPKTFTTLHLENWDVMTPIVDEFMSDMRIETRKKVQLRDEDEEMEQRSDGRNVFGELLTESYEISPFDRASREVKWMFSTVPYGRVIETEDGLEWQPSTDHNEFGMNTFIPFRNVYGRVLYYTANCTTTELILNRFYLLAHTGPDKAMFLYLYNSLSELIANRWKPIQEEGNKSNPTKNSQGLVFDANIDSTIIKVIRSLQQQQNDFVWATSKDVQDKDGNKQKQIDIRTTLYQKKAIETTRSWKDLLSTGMSDVLKYDPETQTYKFKSGIKINVFKKIYSDLFVGQNSFISAYNKIRKLDPEDVVLDWLYLENSGNVRFSEITADDVKTYLHNALLHCGIDISEEILDQWLLLIMEDNPTITNQMDALYAMLSDLHSAIRPSNFFARLANVEENGQQLDAAITAETITIAFNSGFVKELANKQNEYDLRTLGLMTVAAHNNQYYIVSERNYVNDVKDIINAGDRNDQYILMLMEDSFASGSVIVDMLLKNLPIHLDAATFVGMKTENVGDQGRDYFEIELNEDIISKLELLQEGYMLAPTISDKKTYHVLRGVPLVGMKRGERSNTQCYSTNYSTGLISIIDLLILDRFIAYFKSERDAVEKAIIAYETDFYKNNPGKKIVNYSDENGLKFSSFCCLPLANGEKIYLNKDTSENPRVNLAIADEKFFNATRAELRAIMQRILLARAQEDIKKIEEVGLIKKNENGSYENVGLDGATILEMAERRVKAAFGDNGKLSDYVDETGKHAGPRKEFAISSAIQEYCLDCTIKHLMSMQEYQRLFSGNKSFYKWKNKGLHVVDISVDYTKRRGGDISTGGVNVFDIDPIEGMEELGTYRCIEIEDYLVESNTLGLAALIQQFETSELVSAAASILSRIDAASLNAARIGSARNLYQNRDEAEKIIFDKYYKEYLNFYGGEAGYTEQKAKDYATGIINTLKAKARANAMQYFKDINDRENPINVADGATYITDRMCERLLREEGKWDDDIKYAFEVLRGEHGADVLSEEGRKLYKSILDVVIGTQKYTATGFRKSDDGQGGTLMTPYYNKTALFPVFEQIAYGKMGQILQAMRNNNVDVMMMTSAVKTGSQGAITLDQMISGQSFTDHTYIQEIRFLRKQLNTDPNEREEMNLGTQTIKIALSNLRMDDDYIDPFTGKTVKGYELYSTIMRCYNILTDIGYELVMLRFAKKYPDGTTLFENSLPAEIDNDGNVIGVSTSIISSIPLIDEKALSIFLHEELMSRDANDNMMDAITYDSENNRLASPISAISQSGWIDSILSAYISKTIIDTKSPGAAYIQRSVFAMEGEGLKMFNDGEDLKLVNEDGSMDAIISIDFFKDIIPDYENKTFEEARQWLIKHKLVGKEAKTYTISYRIPTQAQASINALKFVDVVPIIRDSIILPKDFTRLTGSDFDIDKLFLSRLFINPETVSDEDNMFTFFDNVDSSNKDELLETLHKAFVNKLFQNYITLLMDKNSANTKYRPIDSDTELWKDVYRDLYPESQNPVESMQQDTIVYLTELKNNFVVGKIGIGPFALNNNNHIYTMLYNISVRSSLLESLGQYNLNMATLYRGSDIYGNSIMSWLSGGINSHVDIAKDPFITKMNVNKYTYNIVNFLIRAGFGRNALWFLNQPVIKELARRQNNITGQYLKTTTKSLFDAQKDVFEQYKKELGEQIPEEVLNKEMEDDFYVPIVHPDGSVSYHPCLGILQTVLGRPLNVKDVLLDRIEVFKKIKYSDKLNEQEKKIARTGLISIYNRDFEKVYANDLVEKDLSKSMIYNSAKYGDSSSAQNSTMHSSILKYLSVAIFDKINSNEAKICSDVVKFTKIDTKKHGSTIAAQLDYRIEYQKFIAGLQSTRPKIEGMTDDLFGISDTDVSDVLGSLSSINLNGRPVILNHTGLPGVNINRVTSGVDITEAGYIKYDRNEFSSFIHNKTRKAINALTSVLRNESVESTYGFEYIWRVVKNDFGKSALTEDMQTKLRSTILGAIKSNWVFSKMRSLGINPISLFKDGENSFSLAHELYRMKTLSIRYVDQNHVNRKGEVCPRTIITTVGKLFKDNELLKILHDAHSKDEYSQTGRLGDILDFIKVHIPFTDDSRDSNKYIQAWRELYENDLTKDFAVKLMFYSFITSNDSGGSNLFKYVPFEMLKEYGLFDAERHMINRLNDLAFLYSEDPNLLEEAVRPIVDRVETILCEDFDFSLPYHLETIEERQDRLTGAKTKVPVLQYTGFASKFGKEVRRDGRMEKCDRIPYIFIPARINAYNGISRSKTITVNRPYIRVYNPVRNYENEEKYFIYKRIGEIYINRYNVFPIYKLVNSSMYTLGQYKIYNYNNEMPISSTLILGTISNYILSENYSIDDVDGFIKKVVSDIELSNEKRKMSSADKVNGDELKRAAGPLYQLDEILDKMHKRNVQEKRIFNIRTKLLSKFKDGSYIEFYKNLHNTGKADTISDLTFVKTSSLFTDEEKSIADLMLTEIKKFNEILEQIKANKKLPTRQIDPRTYHMHSGGAFGSDIGWAYYAKQYGIPDDPLHISHYYYGQRTPNGNVALTQEQFFEGLDKVYIADLTLHRLDNTSKDRQDKIVSLLARNWMLVKNSDSIFAIGELKYGKVDGGTGWAVLMAIDSGKPVHVFNLSTELWFTYDTEKRTWVVESTPRLTKNFAGIGTRSIDKDIERKTANYKKPVKYVGDKKRQAAIKAMNDVYTNTFGSLRTNPAKPVVDEIERILGGGPEVISEIQDAISVAKLGISFESQLQEQSNFFTAEEVSNIKQGLGSDGKLRVMSVSRLTDPAFFADEVIAFLKENAKKDLSDPTRVVSIELWTKHDGLPIKRILDACKKYRVAPMVSFSITGLGGTAMEDGVLTYWNMLQKIAGLIKNGTLNAATTTIRIDPILVGHTKIEDIQKIVNTAKRLGIKKFVTSLVQSYGYTEGTNNDRHVISGINDALAKDNLSYDWEKYYGRITQEDFDISSAFVKLYKEDHPTAQWGEIVAAGAKLYIRVVTKSSIGKIHFTPKREYIEEIGQVLTKLDSDPGITIQTCSFNINGLKVSACLDPLIIERVVGVDVTRDDGTYDRDTSRPECMCYGVHQDFFKGKGKECYSSCGYCYAAHSGDASVSEENGFYGYYNEDGSLKDYEYTLTDEQVESVYKTVLSDGRTTLSLSSHTKEKPRQIVLEPAGENKYYIHLKMWDDIENKVPASNVSNEEKKLLFDALYNELPDGAEILLPEYSPGYYPTRGAIAGLLRLARDPRFVPGTKGVVKYLDKDGSIKEYEGTSFVKAPTKEIPQGVIKKHSGYWSRSEAENNPRTLYVFTDNVDRDSGSNPVSEDSWYGKKYGPGPIHYPTSTAAVVRGLDNARPISTMHFFYKTHGYSHPQYNTDSKALWHDSDVEEFKRVIRSELQDIVDAFNSGKYDTIMFPDGDGLFNTKLSQISKGRTPELYKALSDLLKEYGFDELIPKESEKKIINVSSYDEETKSLSNFAIRPFETELAKGTPKMKMKSVEHAFLSSKAYFAWNAGDITDKQFWDFIKYINAREGKDVKSAGRAIPMSLTTIDEWNKVSDKVLEVMMLRSFLLNETAASQLLNTGNAEFTHNYKNGQPIEPKTPKRFGNLLSKVRSKLRDESNRKQECK